MLQPTCRTRAVASTRLHWGEVPRAYASLTSRRQSPTDHIPDPITSSRMKELLVTDYGISLDSAAHAGACGACTWNRGLAALEAGHVARAATCFAMGQVRMSVHLWPFTFLLSGGTHLMVTHRTSDPPPHTHGSPAN